MKALQRVLSVPHAPRCRLSREKNSKVNSLGLTGVHADAAAIEQTLRNGFPRAVAQCPAVGHDDGRRVGREIGRLGGEDGEARAVGGGDGGAGEFVVHATHSNTPGDGEPPRFGTCIA